MTLEALGKISTAPEWRVGTGSTSLGACMCTLFSLERYGNDFNNHKTVTASSIYMEFRANITKKNHATAVTFWEQFYIKHNHRIDQ